MRGVAIVLLSRINDFMGMKFMAQEVVGIEINYKQQFARNRA